eukprot:672920-Pyramimonas_sp.AAC.1
MGKVERRYGTYRRWQRVSSMLEEVVVRIQLQLQCEAWPARATSWLAQRAFHHSNGYWEPDIDYLRVWRIPTTTQQ